MNSESPHDARVLPLLYSFRRCPYAMRARLALGVSGQACELREVLLRERPAELYAASEKGTVPVLVLADGTVLEQSLDVMTWTLGNRDPEAWLPETDQDQADSEALIQRCDGEFKRNLDGYKYASREGAGDRELQRELASKFLMDLEARLQRAPYLLGSRPGLADMALFPFVRQFAFTDRSWFDQQPWPGLRAWLDGLIGSRRFTGIMAKHPVWFPGETPLIVDWS
jgi:glutathione S-transferase